VPSHAWWARLLGGILTFNFVCFTWIFFRAGTLENAGAILHGVAGLTVGIGNITPIFAAVLLAAALVHCLPPKWFEGSVVLAARVPFWAQGLAMAALILLIQTLAGRGAAPFVYGNF